MYKPAPLSIALMLSALFSMGAAAAEPGMRIPVRADPAARYYVENFEVSDRDHVEIMARRVGREGISFTLHRVRCGAMMMSAVIYDGATPDLDDQLVRRDEPMMINPQKSVAANISDMACGLR